MRLRKYQREAVRNVEAAMRKDGNVLLVSPTGSGKSVMGAAVVKRHGGHVLWVAHRIELLRQARAELIEAGVPERHVGILSGPDKVNTDARVLVCSIAMARDYHVSPVDLVVVDEAHRIEAASYQDVVGRYDVPVLGLTATPWRMDGKPLGETFGTMVVASSVTALEVDGHIARPVTYGVPRERAKELVRGLGGKEYSDTKLAARMGTSILVGDAVSELRKHASDRRTLLFAVNREHGKKLLNKVRKAGFVAEYVDGTTRPSERSEIIERLASGDTQVVVNVDVLTEGFDCPPVECVAIVRPTRSLTRFLQYCGRASRPYGERRPVILDMGGNCWRFGLPNDDREWSLDSESKPARDGTAPVRTCEECGAVFPARLDTCPVCGAEQEKQKRADAEREELERLREQETKKAIARERFTKLAEVADMSAVTMSTEEWVEMMVRDYWNEAG